MGRQVERCLCGVGIDWLGELQFVTKLVVNAKLAIAPGLSLDCLRDGSARGSQVAKKLIEIRSEDV